MWSYVANDKLDVRPESEMDFDSRPQKLCADYLLQFSLILPP